MIMKNNQKFNTQRKFYLIMTILTAAVIFYASTIETTAGVPSGLNLAMVYHFGVFFMFTFFLTLTVINHDSNLTRTLSIILLISLIYAFTDELHQLFVPGRFASLKDILTDITGSVFALVPIVLLRKLKKV